MKVNGKLSYQIVDTKSGLEDFARSLEKEKIIAVDLEADSMFHFKEKVCLVQIATKKINAIIDPLKINDLSPLKPLFANRDIKKIFHGADYDVRSLYRDFQITISNLFDTQIAALFLGLEATGLDALLQNRLSINLDKKYQKKDWSKRPLPEEMVEYAAKDAIFLLPLAELLEKELREKQRLSWVYEESAILSKVRPALSNTDRLYLKFKGAGQLSRRTLAALERLLQLRLKIAKRKDKPLFKIFSNRSMIKLAEAKPANLRRLKKTNALSARQITMYGNVLVEAINKALNMPENRLPVYPRGKAPLKKPEVVERIKVLKPWRDKKAKTLEINPSLILTKAMINNIAIHNPLDKDDIERIKGLKNWQKEE
ncbi:MAG: ribonuclease D, partial [Desulfobacterales bacterium]|nr:ribonuclease D [Desulfobacterales bacterium]